jgi:hypothetical protein
MLLYQHCVPLLQNRVVEGDYFNNNDTIIKTIAPLRESEVYPNSNEKNSENSIMIAADMIGMYNEFCLLESIGESHEGMQPL